MAAPVGRRSPSVTQSTRRFRSTPRIAFRDEQILRNRFPPDHRAEPVYRHQTHAAFNGLVVEGLRHNRIGKCDRRFYGPIREGLSDLERSGVRRDFDQPGVSLTGLDLKCTSGSLVVINQLSAAFATNVSVGDETPAVDPPGAGAAPIAVGRRTSRRRCDLSIAVTPLRSSAQPQASRPPFGAMTVAGRQGVSDLVQDGVGDLRFGVQKRERARQGNDLRAILATAETPAGVIELKPPVVQPVSGHEGERKVPGIERVHVSRPCDKVGGIVTASAGTGSLAAILRHVRRRGRKVGKQSAPGVGGRRGLGASPARERGEETSRKRLDSSGRNRHRRSLLV